MFANLNKIYEKVVCRGKSLWKMAGEKSFWGGIENFRFFFLILRKAVLEKIRNTIFLMRYPKVMRVGAENKNFLCELMMWFIPY